MFKDLNPFVPSERCLRCDGCCRFQQPDTYWQPKITAEEKESASAASRTARGVLKITDRSQGKVPTIAYADYYICHFFNPADNTCGIYHVRPFECQLYPFLLIRERDIFQCGVHLLCPHVQEVHPTEAWFMYLRYLRDFFTRKDVRVFLKRNPGLFGEYPGGESEIELLFTFESLKSPR